MNKDTFDYVAFIKWMEQIVDFFLSLFDKLGNLGGGDAAEDETAGSRQPMGAKKSGPFPQTYLDARKPEEVF